MLIDIFDVEHGGCAVITSPTGEKLMLDCGHSSSSGWRPSGEFLNQSIETLMLLNLDEDHVSDFPNLFKNCSIRSLITNPSISDTALLSMKQAGMGVGVESVYNSIKQNGPGFLGDCYTPLGGIHWHIFWNRYGLDFTDTNNLSLAAFISFGGFTILFGGDMERHGWENLLRLNTFRQRLRDVKVYVASHHGRENGKSEELMALMRPEAIVFSDDSITFETQRGADWYRHRALGIPDVSSGISPIYAPTRKLVTTRKDGHIRIFTKPSGRYLLTWSGKQTANTNSNNHKSIQSNPIFNRNLV